jgi:hypothetical protein
MNISHEEALSELEEAYLLLLEFEDTINNSLEGDHPYSYQVFEWLNRYHERSTG